MDFLIQRKTTVMPVLGINTKPRIDDSFIWVLMGLMKYWDLIREICQKVSHNEVGDGIECSASGIDQVYSSAITYSSSSLISKPLSCLPPLPTLILKLLHKKLIGQSTERDRCLKLCITENSSSGFCSCLFF